MTPMQPGEPFIPYKVFGLGYRERILYFPWGLWVSRLVSQQACAVWAILAHRAGRNGDCWPSMETIAADLGITPRHVANCINELRAAGLITSRRDHGGRGASNRYVFLWHIALERV
jgi:hypothetical protein